LLGIINDILDFSKIEANRLDIEAIPFDLRSLLEDVMGLLAVRAYEKSLEFICHIDPDVDTLLKGDPGRLRQILLNLGGNAIKFTSQGEIQVAVYLESETETQVKVRFNVRDTGIGIPEDKIGILFTAFQQVDASTTRKFGGTGLGLAISKRLTELMGGEIGIISQEGMGSTFWFTVVLEKQDETTRKKEVQPLTDLCGQHILIVDDNATNREVLGLILKSWGVRFEEADSGKHALELLKNAVQREDPFRLAILDMQMPEMDGETLGMTIRNDPLLKDLLLMMMTSLGTRGDAGRMEKIGFQAYLSKPVKQSELYGCLTRVLSSLSVVKKEEPPQLIITKHTVREDQRTNYRILLAEDNLINQKVALKILSKLGYPTEVAANGQEAIDALENQPYDLVLMDVQMPVLDGFEATAAIRSGKTKTPNPRIPIVAMTAHAMQGDREHCLEAGMDDYLAKPISSQELREILERWLKPGAQEIV
jgi:CheY-like chemotaxis protein